MKNKTRFFAPVGDCRGRLRTAELSPPPQPKSTAVFFFPVRILPEKSSSGGFASPGALRVPERNDPRHLYDFYFVLLFSFSVNA